MKKLGKRWRFGQKKILLLPEFPIAFFRISYCFSRISHRYCPNFGKSNGREIRTKAMGNSGKSNGKFGQKQWDIRAKAIAQKFGKTAVGNLGKGNVNSGKSTVIFGQTAVGNSGKSNGIFGRQKQWDIRAKAIARKIRENRSRKFGYRQWEIRAKTMGY